MSTSRPPKREDRIQNDGPLTCGDHHGRKRAAGQRPGVCRARKAIGGVAKALSASFAPPKNSASCTPIFFLQLGKLVAAGDEIGDLFGLLRASSANDWRPCIATASGCG